jgi:hypothetical protein
MTITQTIDSYNNFSNEYHNHVNKADNFWNKYVEAPAMEKLLKPIARGKDLFPEDYEQGFNYPAFMVFKATKV